jgi:quercetin dioxygenase-like cupin family protein
MADDAIWFLQNLALIRVSGRTSGGVLTVVELTGPPGDMPPLLVHKTDHEAFGVLEGRLSLHQPGRKTELEPGSFVFAEAGIPHTYRVEGSDPCRWLLLVTPAGFEDFVAEVGEPARALTLPSDLAPPDPAKMAAIAARYGMELLGPPGALPEG